MTFHDTWVEIEPMLRPAIARSPDAEAKRLLSRLMAGEDTLWAIRENGKTVAAVVTTIQSDMRCLIWLVGGQRIREWADAFMEQIVPWAKGRGCVALWGTGRKGWKRIAPIFGAEPINDHCGESAWERRL